MYLQKKYSNQYKLLKFNLLQKKYNNCWIIHYYYFNTIQYIQMKKYLKKKGISCYLLRQSLLNSKLLKNQSGVIFFYSHTANTTNLHFILQRFKFKFLFFKEKRLFSEILFNKLKFRPVDLIEKLKFPCLRLLKILNTQIRMKADIT